MLSSSKLAIALVLLLILFSLAGAVLPQEGGLEPGEIAAWQAVHPTVTGALEPFGLFHVFHSWPFFAVIFSLGVNTLTCTILRFLKEGGYHSLRKPGAVRMAGFLLLHLSLIVLFTGGFLSAAARLSGYIVLTEGQGFQERHDRYLRLVEGPLRPEHHQDFMAVLKEVRIAYEQGRYPVDVTSLLEIQWQGQKAAEGAVKPNVPFTYKGLTFTQDETGFSPRLVIRDKESGGMLLDSFIALKTFRREGEREYKDFLPLPFLEQRIVMTLLPGHRMEGGKAVKTGEQPDNPLLILEVEDESGNAAENRLLPAGNRITMGKHTYLFADLRRWSAFRIVADPGYPVVLVALWLGFGALLLRYLPDLKTWFIDRSSRDGEPRSQGIPVKDEGVNDGKS